MDTVITIKMSPDEHRLIREVLVQAEQRERELAQDHDNDVILRRDARAQAIRIGALLERI